MLSYFMWSNSFLSKDELLRTSSENININNANEVRLEEDNDFDEQETEL